MMRKYILLLLAMSLPVYFAFADKLPKYVDKARQAVAGVVTYKQGIMLHNGTAVFAGECGDVLSSRSLFVGADSAVVIDYKGVVRPVTRIIGVDEMFDGIRVRVAADKKLKSLPVSTSSVVVGEALFQLGYGVGKSGFAEQAIVERVDSVYSRAYYTLSKPMELHLTALPLVNGKGELVALMQEAASVDTVNSYAIGVSMLSKLEVSVPHFGKGFYPSMEIRTALPRSKENALSCLYMQSIIGDSISNRNVIDDFIAQYPQCFEGYISKAEYEAVTLCDLSAAEHSWNRAFELAENPAEVHFCKAKVINKILLEGDSTLHPMLSLSTVLTEMDKAMKADPQSLYLNGKAEIYYQHGYYASAAECYIALAATDMRSPEVFAKASQCYQTLNDYERSVALLDSAVACIDAAQVKLSAPYILTRALVNVAAEKYRKAVLDYNRYEEIVGGESNAEFYYLREQAELRVKMYSQALRDIDNAIYLDPQNVAYYIEKGLLCYRVKLSDEGIRTLTEAVELAPGVPDIHYLLGRLYVQKGEKEKGVTCLEKAVELGHSDAAAVLQQLGN